MKFLDKLFRRNKKDASLNAFLIDTFRYLLSPQPVELWKAMPIIRAVAAIAFRSGSAQWVQFKGEKQVEGKAISLLKRSELGGYMGLIRAFGVMELTGNYFWLIVKDVLGRALYLKELPVDRVGLKVDETGRLTAYSFVRDDGKVVDYPKSWVIHLKLPPLSPVANPYLGAPLIEGLIDAVHVEKRSLEYQKTLLDNSAIPALIVISEKALTDEQKRRFERKWRDRFIGGRSGSVAFLSGGKFDVKPISFTPADLNLKELHGEMVRHILQMAGVAPAVIGDTTNANRAVAYTALQFFDMLTVVPRIEMVKEELNRKLLPAVNEKDSRIEYRLRTPEDPAIMNQAAKNKLDSMLRAAMLGFVTPNEYRAELGLPPIEGGDETMMPMVPSEGQGEKNKVFYFGETTVDTRVDEKFKQWASAVVVVERLIKDYHAEILKWFSKIEARLRKLPKRIGQKGMVIKEDDFVTDNDAERFVRIWIKFFVEAGIAGARNFEVELRALPTISLRDIRPEIIQAAAEREHLIRRIPERLMNQIRELIEQAINEGWSIEQVQEAVERIIRTTKSHAYTIATTEMFSAFNRGGFEVAQKAGVEKVMWRSAQDNRVRPSHAEIDGEVVQLGQPFSNGLRYPHDPIGDAEEVINCRCILVPAIEGG